VVPPSDDPILVEWHVPVDGSRNHVEPCHSADHSSAGSWRCATAATRLARCAGSDSSVLEAMARGVLPWADRRRSQALVLISHEGIERREVQASSWPSRDA
jgi:hypothetical protein